MARHQYTADIELDGEPCGVQWSRTTKRDQSIVTRVMAALHANDPDRARHIGGDHGNDALRGGQGIDAQLGREKVDLKGASYNKDGDKWKSGAKTMDNSSVQNLIDKLRDLSATKFVEKGGGA